MVPGFLVPERGGRVVGRRAQAFFVDLPHIGLRDLVTALRGWEPYLQRRRVVRPVVRNVFAATDRAFRAGGLDGASRRHIGDAGAELAHLSGQHAIHDQQSVRVLAIVDDGHHGVRCREACRLTDKADDDCGGARQRLPEA